MEISAMRYELIEVLGRNGMDVSIVERKEKTVLAKRMKVWERRLMKDFHVAPVGAEGEEETAEEPVAGPETGLDKFRRVARQVASASTSSKWGQVIQEVGIQTNSQIGRCRNRESFKNQQNLLRAMEEARRLVQRSPLHRSGSVSPVEIVDPTANTLMELLKNIKDEIDELSPVNTLNPSHGGKSRAMSPAMLIQELSKSPKPTKSPEIPKKSVKSPEAPKILTPSIPEVVSPPPKSESTPPSVTSPPSVSSPPSVTSPPAVSSPPSVTSPPRLTSPPPEILVTCPDSQPETLIDIDEPQNPYKVIKRKAPSAGDIAVSRPVAAKPPPGQGMIPPPPSKVEPAPPKVETSPPKQPSPKKEPPPTPRRTSIPSTGTLALDPGVSGSREKLVPESAGEPSADANKAASSPPACLRPIKHVGDVKTIKRQPKEGWL